MSARVYRLGGASIGPALLAVILAAGAGNALARPAAPIEFASAGAIAQETPRAAARAGGATKAQPRVTYRYPDQPDVEYGQGAPRAVSSEAGPIDLRGELGAAVRELGRPAPAIQPVSMAAPKAAPSRPEWLERERVGAPYEAHGKVYVPTPEPGFSEKGLAGQYSPDFAGRATATGEAYNPDVLTGAHPTLPLPSLVQVTNLENGREVIVRINDRGPFEGGRMVNVSPRTAEVLGFGPDGSAQVHVRYLGPAPKRVGQDGAMRATPRPQPAVQRTAAPAAVSAGASQNSDGFIVQIGAFGAEENARRARAQAASLGPVQIDAGQSAGRPVHRVRVGPFADRAAADAARENAAALGFANAIVSVAP